MKMWEALLKVNNGCKVRKKCWKETRYISLCCGRLLWDDGSAVEDLIDDGCEWEIYERKLEKPVDGFWGEFYRSIMSLADSYQNMLDNCDSEDGCMGCSFREACARYDDIYYELKFLNDEYDISNK